MQLNVWPLKSQISLFNTAFSKMHPIAYDLNKYFSTFLNRNFLKMQFPNGLFSAIWFKIALFLYQIAIPNTPLMTARDMVSLIKIF
jgi:hypothetical protein